MRIHFRPSGVQNTFRTPLKGLQNSKPNGNNWLNRMVEAKHNSIEATKEELLKTQVRNLKNPSTINEADKETISQFFTLASSIYSGVERALQKGVESAKILVDSNASEEDKNSAVIQLKEVAKIIDNLGRRLEKTFRIYNSATSGKLKESIGIISDELLKNGALENNISIDSMFNFSSKSLNIDKLSSNTPEAILDAFTNALKTVRTYQSSLNQIYMRFVEKNANTSEIRINNRLDKINIYI